MDLEATACVHSLQYSLQYSYLSACDVIGKLHVCKHCSLEGMCAKSISKLVTEETLVRICSFVVARMLLADDHSTSC